MNPFYIGREFKKEAFIDREKETEEVMKMIESSNNIVLYAPRRFGKTWFARNLSELMKDRGIDSVWIDMFSTVTVKQFISRLNEERAKILKLTPLEYVRKFFADHLSSFSVSAAGIGLEFKPSSEAEIWEILFKSLMVLETSESNGLIVFLDEAQEMAKMGKQFEGILRTVIQHQRKTVYIFLGSRNSIIEEIFFKKEHPLFKSAIKYDLSKYLPHDKTEEFIKTSFVNSGKAISNSAVETIIRFSKLHPLYVQLISSEVWNFKDKIDESDVRECISKLLERNDYFFRNQIENINSKYALAVLKMIASDEFSYSAETQIKWEIKSPASISKLVDNLEEKEIILKVNGKYVIEDPIFEEFIKRM